MATINSIQNLANISVEELNNVLDSIENMDFAFLDEPIDVCVYIPKKENLGCITYEVKYSVTIENDFGFFGWNEPA